MCTVASQQIGVISPYHAQVQKIRLLLKDKEIKVGSVEEYQGQVRITISPLEYFVRLR